MADDAKPWLVSKAAATCGTKAFSKMICKCFVLYFACNYIPKFASNILERLRTA